MIPVISVVAGHSNTGKTTLLCQIIKSLKKRGYKVATIKHDVHGFEIDHPGKDTYNHRQAGADIVMISSPKLFAMIEGVEEEYSLDQLLNKIQGVDIVFTEGYKKMDKPKIEVFREGISKELVSPLNQLLAIVTDVDIENIDVDIENIKEIPQFSFNEIEKLVDLIEDKYLT
ncbi:molybdopterin guanine dinucleotide biosynthesis accessory protein MobB [Anaerobranca californiensis DSM 14826]|jgi:molybdopterin-guanine dinucleotide biosynthesis protein B|uniref:Molybdopterin guanine dinucleotide biosynthesis accessory protein MobB n=1 Tax=Anaerobranca californiensis DSM 14826 TaxID=1120989 RepID=A0A1M6S0Z7_9FIRM|nr:molybdopterin-guanine dinucleotide biosynthesis protein B [Anaerobranca californiensis]SHK38373.1 molybdopterin guanine dinucleotide biosynthesis accessory protein MobB [Anaerobranca californiensis DSM 14826]